MFTYKITHAKGVYTIDVVSTQNGTQAHVIDEQGDLKQVMDVKDGIDAFDDCRTWASTNIHGEFSLEPSVSQTR